MTHPSRRLFLATPAATLLARSTAPAPAPLFRDPIYDGASDPVAIWNRQEKNWWLLYTQRRANVDGPGVARVHGCDIGVARSTDDGHSWRYLGILPGLEYERHLLGARDCLARRYLSHVRQLRAGSPSRVVGRARRMLLGREAFHAGIDHAIRRERERPNRWRMWYKDEDNHMKFHCHRSGLV